MNTNQTIGIIGCGWLGRPLANGLLEDGYRIHGSTTSLEKLSALASDGIEPFLIELSKDKIEGDISGFLLNCDTIIINIPPGLRKGHDDYKPKMTRLCQNIENSHVKHVLFIGSTSVYDDTFPIATITESSETSQTNKAKLLLSVEELFQNNAHFKTTILRFSGLFGEDRHPAKFLSGRTQIKNPDGPVNLIHLQDCVAIIRKLIATQLWNEILNASSTSHPTRKTYYSEVCKAMNIPEPVFDESELSRGKIISSDKLVQLLKYEFRIQL
ncbi:SDR family oxidoreductase [Psychroserpens sp.]|uniref:SDR family oxidoreductase n=1 Tax=Psychroserpens sp. TaxID=2020870 RepID=UPI001B22FA62|nr:SDR family oxidoreductase [Psychroserpens sp.]MBO6605504.1 SDR family oxidoreductase [Psychroserpens sp.]MBO6630655.1 SDR family oxidoreductase [Psychroserpens sp.]MBO6653687.1 SDR family oxidoreductase [Psychroserpens sp.]MBO6682008.1 SDR family oxidoreductase [Psychroserpens sp.]MBO6748878.1 SDR family oxidoreductase [Psychroserpens sp.]